MCWVSDLVFDYLLFSYFQTYRVCTDLGWKFQIYDLHEIEVGTGDNINLVFNLLPNFGEPLFINLLSSRSGIGRHAGMTDEVSYN